MQQPGSSFPHLGFEYPSISLFCAQRAALTIDADSGQISAEGAGIGKKGIQFFSILQSFSNFV
jgi:hypothetical protein